MTRKQLNAAKEEWYRTEGPYLICLELNCILMIHTLLIYHFRPDSEEFPFPEKNCYLQDYIRDLGMERVKILWEEQLEDYRKAEVGAHPLHDPDGCTYNYCIWADEK